MPFYTSDDIVIDPAMKDMATYMRYYDYDLLGTPIGTTRYFSRDPIGYMKEKITMYKPELIFSSVILLAVYFTYLVAKFCFGSALQFLKSAWMFNKEWRRAVAETKAREARGLPPDKDIKAQAIYRTLTTYYNIKSSTREAPLPDNAVEYESSRFALQTAWPIGPALETLMEADPFRSFEDEPIEGVAEDEELERLLAEMELEDDVEGEPEGDLGSENYGGDETGMERIGSEHTFESSADEDEEKNFQEGALMISGMLAETESSELGGDDFLLREREEFPSEGVHIDGQNTGYPVQVADSELESWFESNGAERMVTSNDSITKTATNEVVHRKSFERDSKRGGAAERKFKKNSVSLRAPWRY